MGFTSEHKAPVLCCQWLMVNHYQTWLWCRPSRASFPASSSICCWGNKQRHNAVYSIFHWGSGRNWLWPRCGKHTQQTYRSKTLFYVATVVWGYITLSWWFWMEAAVLTFGHCEVFIVSISVMYCHQIRKCSMFWSQTASSQCSIFYLHFFFTKNTKTNAYCFIF